MRSEVATLKLIQQKTKVSVPEVYAFDMAFENDISTPYIRTTFLPGEPVTKVCYARRGGEKTHDDFRLNVFTSMAEAMA
ncbi:hypothetical protein QBC36DRAFT_288861 [Triangularia setosa]|uniref:Uncharacterized protein n=1 Tax=Triangularia setosa TaxID=2587417 RepID=A0AAN6WCP4_9PEZI|nr:hypothetical protein QBC36DRAFT_288861 [Podospora setosa]